MKYIILAITVLSVLFQFVATEDNIVACQVAFFEGNIKCAFDWRNETECLGASKYLKDQLGCQDAYEGGCTNSIKKCSGWTSTFRTRCKNIQGVIITLTELPPKGNCLVPETKIDFW